MPSLWRGRKGQRNGGGSKTHGSFHPFLKGWGGGRQLLLLDAPFLHSHELDHLCTTSRYLGPCPSPIEGHSLLATPSVEGSTASHVFYLPGFRFLPVLFLLLLEPVPVDICKALHRMIPLQGCSVANWGGICVLQTLILCTTVAIPSIAWGVLQASRQPM